MGEDATLVPIESPTSHFSGERLTGSVTSDIRNAMDASPSWMLSATERWPEEEEEGEEEKDVGYGR